MLYFHCTFLIGSERSGKGVLPYKKYVGTPNDYPPQIKFTRLYKDTLDLFESLVHDFRIKIGVVT